MSVYDINGNVISNNSSSTTAVTNKNLKDGDFFVRAINHRGYCDTAPENTLPAYKLSKQKGFNYVETDISYTSDGVAVLLHDKSINNVARTTDGDELSETVNIADITYEEALTYDFGIHMGAEYAGTKIATLEEFLVLCRNIGLHAYLELKASITNDRVKEIIELVKKTGMKEYVTYISFDTTFLSYVKSNDKTARIGVLLYNFTESGLTTVKSLKTDYNEVFADVMYSFANVADIENIQKYIDNDIPIEIWTVNTESYIVDMPTYVSGVTSDSLRMGQVLYDSAMAQ